MKMVKLFENWFSHLKLYIVLLTILILTLTLNRVDAENVTIDMSEGKIVSRYQVAKFNFIEVSGVYAITLWILLGSLAKIGINQKILFCVFS